MGVHGSPGTVVGGCCAAAPGSTIRCGSAPPAASGSVPEAGTSTAGFVLPGRLLLESLYHYLLGSKGFAPVDFFVGYSFRLASCRIPKS